MIVMKKFIRKITASTSSDVANKIGELQETSNLLVDSILELVDNLPEIEQAIADYDRENVEYGDSIADELPNKLDWAIKQLRDVIEDVDNISYFFLG
jgi:hypothetical protein